MLPIGSSSYLLAEPLLEMRFSRREDEMGVDAVRLSFVVLLYFVGVGGSSMECNLAILFWLFRREAFLENLRMKR